MLRGDKRSRVNLICHTMTLDLETRFAPGATMFSGEEDDGDEFDDEEALDEEEDADLDDDEEEDET